MSKTSNILRAVLLAAAAIVSLVATLYGGLAVGILVGLCWVKWLRAKPASRSRAEAEAEGEPLHDPWFEWWKSPYPNPDNELDPLSLTVEDHRRRTSLM